jgi:hypothetical protein
MLRGLSAHFALLMAITLALFVSDQVHAADVAGEWIGAYGYEDGRAAVPFVLTVSQNGKIITGHITEVQTFGDRSVSGKLGANIVGSVDGHVVAFTKTYDGTGGQIHSINYRGTLVVENNTMFMFGTWRLDSAVGAWFASISK